MEADEIQAEVAKRKKRAKDLKIGETLWSLHRRLVNYKTWLSKDPDKVYSEVGKTLEFSDDQPEFVLGHVKYQIISKEQPSFETETTSPGAFEPDRITLGTLSLRVNDQKMFKFEWSRRTESHHDAPVFTDQIGEITRFIEGPWVTELSDLLVKIEDHTKSVRDKREAPKKAQELEELKRRFGI